MGRQLIEILFSRGFFSVVHAPGGGGCEQVFHFWENRTSNNLKGKNKILEQNKNLILFFFFS